MQKDRWMRHTCAIHASAQPQKGGTASARQALDQGGWTDPGLIRNGLTSLYQLSLMRSYSGWH